MKRDAALAILCVCAAASRRRYGITELSLLGSVARDEAGEASDVDVLVSFDTTPSFTSFMELKFELEERLDTRVDLVTRSGLKPRVRRTLRPKRCVSRDPRLYLEDIVRACLKIERYTAGLDVDRFVGDERTCDAVLRNLEVVGEAAKRVPPDVRTEISGVP